MVQGALFFGRSSLGDRSFWKRSGLPVAQGNAAARQRGSVLIIVLWIAFGLVSMALYFGHSMFFEFRAAENQAAGLEAEQAIEGAARYVGFMLTNLVQTEVLEPGWAPALEDYEREEVLLGDATFWLIGRSPLQPQGNLPFFSLVDEASKLNLNTATLEMLEMLPGMTPQLAAAIIDWRDEDSELTPNGAETEHYQIGNFAYQCKNAPFDSVEELRLVAGAYPELLYGEDYNRNGMLDPNEDDGDVSPPLDNRDGRLERGLLEFLTVYSLEPNLRADGSARIDVNSGTNLTEFLQENFDAERAGQIASRIQLAGGNFTSLLDFFRRSQMTADEFALIEGELAVTNAAVLPGLININTAPAEVLACIPGIGIEKAQELVGLRQAKGGNLRTLAWASEALDETAVASAGPYLTPRSYQFTADIAAVGRLGRGYRRAQFIFDTSEAAAKIVFRRDLSRLGWALGLETRERIKLLALNQRYRSYR